MVDDDIDQDDSKDVFIPGADDEDDVEPGQIQFDTGNELIKTVTEYAESTPSVERVDEREEAGTTVLTTVNENGQDLREFAVIGDDTDAITDVLEEMHAGKCVLVVADEDDAPEWLSDSIEVIENAEVREAVRGGDTDDDGDVEVDTRGLGPDAGPDPDEVDPDIDPENITLTGSMDSTVTANLLTDQEDVEAAVAGVESVELDEELQSVMDGEPENEGTVTEVVALHCRVVSVERGGNKYDPYADIVVADYSGAAKLRVHGDGFETFEDHVGDEVVVTAVGHSYERRGIEYTTTDATDVIELQSDDYPAGYYLDAPSPLEDIPSIFATAETKAEAWSRAADAVLEEYEVKAPFGTAKTWLYVADESRADYGVWVPEALDRLENVLDDHIPPQHNKSHDRREIRKNIKNRARVEPDAFAEGVPDDADLKWMVGVKNGVIDLKTGELHDHAPHWRLRSKLPVEYKPDEYDGLGDGIDWFLDDVCQSDEDREMCMAMAAHALMRHHNIKSAFPILGPADTGKTKWHGIVKRLTGYDNVATINFDSFAAGEGFETGKIMDAHAVLDDDASGKKINDLNYLKKVTGGEEVSVNRKYEKLADFQPYATVSWLSNDPAVFGERNSGVKSRLYPIVMPHRHTEDPDDGHKMAIDAEELEDRIYAEEEIEALLVAAVEKAQEMAETGKPGSERTEKERWELYHWYSDASLRFQRDYLQSKTGAKMKKQAVYEVYAAMCQQDGIEPMSDTQFWTSMRKSAEISFEDGSWIGDKRAVEHIMLSEDALEIAPEWIVEEYESEVETGIKTNPLDRVTPIEDLEFGPTGIVEGRVIGRRYLQGEDGSGVKIRIQDDTGRLDVVAYDDDDEDENPLDGVRVGDMIRTDNGTLTTYNSSPQLQVSEFGSVDIVEFGPQHNGDQVGLPDDDGDSDGDGETVNDTGEGAEGSDEAPTESEDAQNAQPAARADGGSSTGESEEIDATAVQHADSAATVAGLTGIVAGKVQCDDVETIEHRVEKLAERGDIILDGTGMDADAEGDIPDEIDTADGRIVARLASDILHDIESRDSDDELVEDLREVTGDGELPVSGGDPFAGRFDVENTHATNGTLVRYALNALIRGGWLDDLQAGNGGD